MRASRTNVLLLVVSFLSLLFGVYGFLFGGQPATPPANSVATLDAPVETATPRIEPSASKTRRTQNTTAPQPKPQPGRVEETSTAAPVDEPELPHYSGSISGVVLDRDGRPVAGAVVSAVSIEQQDVTSLDLTASLEELRETLQDLNRIVEHQLYRDTTGEDGRFEITNLNPRAAFEVVAFSEQHGKTSLWEVRSGLDVRLIFDSEGLLTVRVLDEAGNPLTRANVRREGNSSSSWGIERGPEGIYRVEWEQWVEWVSFTARGYQPSKHFTQDDIDKPDLEVRLERACALSGVVRGLDGDPLPGAKINIASYVDAQGKPVDMDTFCWDYYQDTDAKGRYFFDSLPPGTYRITARLTSDGALPPVTKEVIVSGETQTDFELDGGASLQVKVVDEDGERMSRFRVNFSDQNGQYVEGARTPGSAPGTGVFRGLPRDRLQVTVSAKGYSPVRLPVDLASGEGALEFKLSKGAVVKGQVVDSSGNLLTSIRTRWTPAGKDPGEATDVWAYAWDGKFSTGPLAPGAWVVDVYADAFLSDKLSSQTVQLAAGNCELSLVVDCPRVLQISVDFDDGLSADWIEVYVRREGTDEWEDYSIEEDNPARSIRVVGLPEGRYYMYAHADRCSSSIKVVDVKDRPLNVTLTMMRPDCVRLTTVEDGSNAALHGLKEGDMLVEYDYQPVASLADLVRLTKLADGREDVQVVVLRNAERLSLKVNGGLLGVSAEGARQ